MFFNRLVIHTVKSSLTTDPLAADSFPKGRIRCLSGQSSALNPALSYPQHLTLLNRTFFALVDLALAAFWILFLRYLYGLLRIMTRALVKSGDKPMSGGEVISAFPTIIKDLNTALNGGMARCLKEICNEPFQINGTAYHFAEDKSGGATGDRAPGHGKNNQVPGSKHYEWETAPALFLPILRQQNLTQDRESLP